jgi:hypothetical protein
VPLYERIESSGLMRYVLIRRIMQNEIIKGPMMMMVYESAKKVAIWLGSQGEKSHLAFYFLRSVLGRTDVKNWTRNILTNAEPIEALNAIAMLFLRPYWRRI